MSPRPAPLLDDAMSLERRKERGGGRRTRGGGRNKLRDASTSCLLAFKGSAVSYTKRVKNAIHTSDEKNHCCSHKGSFKIPFSRVDVFKNYVFRPKF